MCFRTEKLQADRSIYVYHKKVDEEMAKLEPKEKKEPKNVPETTKPDKVNPSSHTAGTEPPKGEDSLGITGLASEDVVGLEVRITSRTKKLNDQKGEVVGLLKDKVKVKLFESGEVKRADPQNVHLVAEPDKKDPEKRKKQDGQKDGKEQDGQKDGLESPHKKQKVDLDLNDLLGPSVED